MNHSCYTKHCSNFLTIIILYVDDILIGGSDRSIVNQIKTELKTRFKMKDIGEAQEFLGIEITRNRANRTLRISQGNYASKLLERYGMLESQPYVQLLLVVRLLEGVSTLVPDC